MESLETNLLHVFERTVQRSVHLIETGASLTTILTCLITGAETAAGSGAVCSILLLDEQGQLRNGASPNLPRDYLDAIDRIKPDPNVGTCAAAAATGCIVITPDFRADDKWAELRHLPLELGFVGAWSNPIMSTDGKGARHVWHLFPGPAEPRSGGDRGSAALDRDRGIGRGAGRLVSAGLFPAMAARRCEVRRDLTGLFADWGCKDVVRG